jgi:hypothetical protein
MSSKIQQLFKRTISIFAMITILQLFLGTSLDNRGLYQLLALSLAIAVVQAFLFKESIFAYSIVQQVIFLIIVWGMVFGANLIFNWHFQLKDLIFLLFMVLAIYFGLRLITYYKVKDEAEEMNLFLKRRKDESEQSK